MKKYHSRTGAAYAAAVFDETGNVKVTLDNAILRVDIRASSTQILFLKSLCKMQFQGRTYLSGFSAQRFLAYIRPHVKCSREMIDKALAVCCQRESAKTEYQKLVWNSAQPLPSKTC